MGWKFTDDYLSQYPALKNSILSLLDFSSHTLTGTAFTGVLDVASTGPALATLGAMMGLAEINVSGTVTVSGNTLTVAFSSTDATAFLQGAAANLPLISQAITAAQMDVKTVVATTDDADEGPGTDQINLSVTFSVKSASVTITSQVPMNGGVVTLTGSFEGVGIQLSDIEFLFNGTNSSQWFPTTQLGPYASGSPSFGLVGVTLVGYITLKPKFSLSLTAVTVVVGIQKLPLLATKLYMDPLAVWITVTEPLSSSQQFTWGIEGSIKLCNYANPGPGGLSTPDFIFDFSMGFPNPPAQNDFTISGVFENEDSLTVSVMIQDLLGAGTDLGIGKTLTIDSFQLDATADVSTGQLTEFSTSIAMSGGFGLFDSFDLEEIAVSIAYSNDSGGDGGSGGTTLTLPHTKLA